MGEVVNINSNTLPDPERFGKVAVLMGGWSAEREVSLNSGQAVLTALQERGVDVVAIDVERLTIIDKLQQGGFDRVFNILHGPGGEDGVIQGVLDVMEIPYTGSNVASSALAMDKLRTKQIFNGANLPTPNFMVLTDEVDLNYVAAELGLPLMIKPALEGSSIGMSKVDHEQDMRVAYELAAQFDGDVIAEQWISGNEYTVAVLAEQALPVIRLETPHTFYDYEAKYVSNDTKYHCPCGLDDKREPQLQRLAIAAFKVIGARGWGRVDFMCDEHGKPYIIELNTVPGMTDHSLVPMAAKAAGIDFDELVYRILAQTLVVTGKDKITEANHVSSS